jgi:C1A family cysteine protease
MIYNLRKQKEDERDFMLSAIVAPQAKLPKSVDLRSQCPPIFDQGQLGSCSANAGCASIATLLKKPTLTLSRLYMYYREREKEGTISQDSGAQMRDICKVAAVGVCEEKYMPYVIADFAKIPSTEATANAVNYKANGYHAVRTLNEIKQVLALGSTVLTGMQVFESFESATVAKTGVVPMPKSNEQNLGGHAVEFVGYEDAKKRLIVRNSWGTAWGDKGYFYMPYDFITQGFAFDFWVLV